MQHFTGHLLHFLVQILGLPMAELASRVPDGTEVANPPDAIRVLQAVMVIAPSVLRATSLLCTFLDIYLELWRIIAD